MARESVKLRVRVQPGAKQTQLVGFQDGVLRLKLTAPPVEGRANAALVAFLADWLGIAKWQVEILRGTSSREKLVAVHGLTDEELSARLDEVSK